MDNSIGDILNGEPTDEPVIETVEEVVETPAAAEEAEPVTAERPRGPDGKFIPKETGVEPHNAEPVPPTTDRLPQAEYAALKDERQKRQQLEARLAELETYLQSQQRQPTAPPPDMFDDPDGFKAHLRDQILAELQPALQQQGAISRAEFSEMQARRQYEDYDAKIEVFKEALAANPFLLNELKQAPDPAVFAYNAANKFLEAKQYGTAAPSREQIEAELREQIEAELREQIMAEINLNRPKAPSTFAGDRSVGSRSGPAWTGPAPLGDLLR
jgi:hypothetical protein